MKTKIVIVDDHQLFREGVKRILEFEKSFEVVAEGDDGTAVLDLISEYDPDVIIMDINMPTLNGVEATAMAMEKYPDAKIIILSIHDDENYVMHALQTGARGYLLKEMDADALIEAAKVVEVGGLCLLPEEGRKLGQKKRLPPRGGGEKASAEPQTCGIRRPLPFLTRQGGGGV